MKSLFVGFLLTFLVGCDNISGRFVKISSTVCNGSDQVSYITIDLLGIKIGCQNGDTFYLDSNETNIKKLGLNSTESEK